MVFQPLYYLPPSKKGRKTSNSQSPKRLKLETSFMHQPVSMIFSRHKAIKTTTHFKAVAAQQTVSFRCHSCNLHFLRQFQVFHISIIIRHQKLQPSSLTIPSRHPPKEKRRPRPRTPRPPPPKAPAAFPPPTPATWKQRCGGGTRSVPA